MNNHQPIKSVFNKNDLLENDNDKFWTRNPVKDLEKESEMGLEFSYISAITKCLVVKDINLKKIKQKTRSGGKYNA